MKNKYYNNAFIGNEKITASFSDKGELLRLYYPSPDYRQYTDLFYVGIKVNDSNIIYLHNDINNTYKQYYTDKTNILNTEINNSYFNLHILQTDAVMIDKNIIIKKYKFKNNNTIDLNLNLIAYSKVISSFNNMAGGLCCDDALIQYSHNFVYAIMSNQKILSHQLNDCERNINSGVIYDKDYIGMAPDSAISYDLQTLKPGEERVFYLMICLKNDDVNINEIEKEVDEIKNIDVEKELVKIENYWKRFLKKHDTFDFEKNAENLLGQIGADKKLFDKSLAEQKLPGQKYFDKSKVDKIKKVYERTILFMPLLINEETGGVSASLEIDEQRDKCGKYAYCWIRDAVLMYCSLQYLNFGDNIERFYDYFLKVTQSSNGMWEQRFYTDGKLAPCWGYQIDETAIPVFGIYTYYKYQEKKKGKKNTAFLKKNLKVLEKAMKFLDKYTDNLLGKKETNDLVRAELEKEYNYDLRDEIYKHPSYDLWEMNEGVHLYSLSAIYAAYRSMIAIYNELSETFENNRLKQDDIIILKAKYEEKMRDIKKYILENLVDKKKNILLRNTNDELTDISVIGAITPFEVFKPTEKIVKNTVDQINLTLRTHHGAYLRFQNDSYINGNLPWIISTSWMALYYNLIGDKDSAFKCLDYVVKSATDLGFLCEQCDYEKNEKWVIGLGWSHAIFIEMLKRLLFNF